MTPIDPAAADRWHRAAAEIRNDPERRASLIRSVYWVSQGDGPRAMPDWPTMERLLDKVLDGEPLSLWGELEKAGRNSNSVGEG